MASDRPAATLARAASERAWVPPAPSLLQFLRDQLAGLSPARWSRMLRITVLVVVVTIVSMALRVPDAALSAYMILFFSRPDQAATVRSGLGGIVTVTLALSVTFICLLLTLSQPALRVLAMACLTFAGMYVLQASPAGPLGMLIAFVTSYVLTLSDPGTPPEVLTRIVLWTWVVVSYPIALLVIADAVAGQRPVQVFDQGVAARLEAAGEYLRGGAGVDAPARMRVERLARAGTGDIAPHVKDRSPSITAARARVVRQLDLLFLLLRELPSDAERAPEVRRALARAGDVCLSVRRVVLGGDGAPSTTAALEEPGMGTCGSPAVLAVALPLLGCVEDLAASVLEARRPGAPSVPGEVREEGKPPPTQAASTSKTTESVRFALKVTLAAMTAYIIYSALHWSGIHTAMLTCYLVAGASVGATIHKLTLRIAGALVGAALGIGAIVFVLPHLETVGGLVILVAAVTLFAAWIATGTEAISYAGLQVGIAFYLTVLQGFSRTSKMVVGRDRVLGILLGNLLMSVVFTNLWPVRVRSSIREALSRAAEALAAAMRYGGSGQATASELREAETAFHDSLRKAIQAAPTRSLEPGKDDGWSLIPAIERIFVRIHAIAHQPIDVQALPPGVSAALSALGESVASWLSDLARAIAAPSPARVFQPAVAAAAELERFLGSAQEAGQADTPVRLRVAWFELLIDDIQRFPAHRLRPLREAP